MSQKLEWAKRLEELIEQPVMFNMAIDYQYVCELISSAPKVFRDVYMLMAKRTPPLYGEAAIIQFCRENTNKVHQVYIYTCYIMWRMIDSLVPELRAGEMVKKGFDEIDGIEELFSLAKGREKEEGIEKLTPVIPTIKELSIQDWNTTYLNAATDKLGRS